jgi:hypothetical protein
MRAARTCSALRHSLCWQPLVSIQERLPMTRLLRVVTSLLLLPFALIATAQTYPSKSVRMVVPFAAGAGLQ